MESYSYCLAVFLNANLSGFGDNPYHRKVELMQTFEKKQDRAILCKLAFYLYLLIFIHLFV